MAGDDMGQSSSSVLSKSGRRSSFRRFMRRSKLNKSSLSHTFNLPPSEDYPELMNVNTATEEQLMTLPGVNRQLAREIVRHRQMIGRFKRVDDLALVSGIGAEKLELLRPEICTNIRKQVSRASSLTQSLDSVRIQSETKLCSVNSSSVFQLQCVPGLNQEIAANIVDYRNKKGPFKSLDDLIKVRGMDIVRLSTVKHHLSLEPRKCESVQHLTNGYVNGWADVETAPMPKRPSSIPKTPHRKSLSMPTNAKLPMTLPNGFATVPVNDILDLLSAYSHRPIVEEVFMHERDGVRCCRLASWNLHQLSVEKVTNPGVREVICRTILENKLSLIAVQDVLEEAALKILCDELNSPVLRRVREWKYNSQRWEYCLSERKER
ncbi:endonuclease/exonuclease/phosphatase family domain-containing protein 1-like isoform X1 [Trichoplusia ni]|uniref:Endonuclease/exonuclease/phosphatase family domain-containing protein 1-like isoform X1 n=2 Tax=Trichoplusia ni TaxID=7111 RepID=A0A7E5X2F6_TRINI|nr:endonuclease/exonuclease/phosphatase family domain-containing protein 1-like isoform X1 [Trichoplusia ni]